jgi:hypothetical protein
MLAMFADVNIKNATMRSCQWVSSNHNANPPFARPDGVRHAGQRVSTHMLNLALGKPNPISKRGLALRSTGRKRMPISTLPVQAVYSPDSMRRDARSL